MSDSSMVGNGDGSLCDDCSNKEEEGDYRWCYDCCEALCPECVLHRHRSHSLERLAVHNEVESTSISDKVDCFREQLKRCKIHCDGVKEIHAALKELKEMIKQNFDDRNDVAGTLVANLEQRLIQFQKKTKEPLNHSNHKDVTSLRDDMAALSKNAKEKCSNSEEMSVKILQKVQKLCDGLNTHL